MNKHISKLVFSKKHHWVVLNDTYMIDTRDGAIYWYEDIPSNNTDFPQWVFDVRNDLRDEGFVK